MIGCPCMGYGIQHSDKGGWHPLSILGNRTVKNASWIIACKIAQMVVNLFVGMLTARYLGPSNYGLINYAGSIVAFMVPVMQLGLGEIMVHQLVQEPEKEGEILGTSVAMSLLSAIMCIAGITGFSMIANAGERDTIIVCVLYSLSLCFQAVELVNYWFQAKLLSKHTSIMMFCAYLVVACYKVFLLATGKSVFWFAVSQALDHMIIAIGCMVIYKKLEGKGFSISVPRAKALFSSSRYYIIAGLMVSIFTQTDKIMIKQMLDSEQTGFYSSAAACAGLTNFVFAAIINSLRPTIFENRRKSVEAFENSLAVLYCIIIYLSLAQCAVMTLLAKPIITFLYGTSYLPAAPALQIVVWYTTFAYLGTIRNIWMLAENKQKYLWVINLTGAVANVLLNYILIPIWGINGAALASLITQFFTNVIVGYIIPSIRRNNRIMVSSLNVAYFIKKVKYKKGT